MLQKERQAREAAEKEKNELLDRLSKLEDEAHKARGALEDQQKLTKDLEERRAKAEQDRIQLERERIEAEKKASQIADIANEEKERMVKFYTISSSSKSVVECFVIERPLALVP